MKFSPEYIKMCEKAELQKDCSPAIGDYTAYGGKLYLVTRPQGNNNWWLLLDTNSDETLHVKVEELIYGRGFSCVFRQDQLWEKLKTIKSVFLYRYGVNAYEIEFNWRRWTGKDIEPLLLQVYMLDNNKSWNGKEWVDAR